MKMKCLAVALTMSLGLSVIPAQATDLTDIYRLALENDPRLLRAAADRDSAKAGVDVSRADWWPQINLGVNYSDSKSDGINTTDDGFVVRTTNTTSFSQEVSLSQTVFNLGTWRATGITEKQAYQAEVNYLLARQQLMLRVTNAYFAVLQAQDSLEFVQAEKRAIERQLEQTKHRFSVGLTAITDVHEAQAQFDNAVAQEIQAQNRVEITLEGLREITGRQHSDIFRLNTERFEPVRPDPQGVERWIQLAHDRNLQLLISRSGLEIAEQRIELARAGHYPRVSLNASYSNRDQDTSSAAGSRNVSGLNSRNIGLQLTLPLYSGGRTVASTEQARADYVSVSQTLEENRRLVEREVRSAYFDVVASISSIRAFEQAVISAESALNATQVGLEVGTRTIVDVLQSTRNLFNARRNLSEARYTYVNRILALYQAAGIISESDLLTINDGLVAPQSQ
ncbi:outer membrane channel protein TolC [Aliidiomarina haloalkalitolerans]|uniref:Outer membrane channel protein TolC n=1 Tax=Aliidiomarina haloalkalitolerans TaxID=859059 RepID=A0A432VQF2_9GAMM|nr:outer membrane channel protein TolC [Aliidiomarina haloalkalitolerans]RUO18397.1 outer membrane channel protein TolC [Aliidiomarina haloalkalitolerans]